MEAFKVLPSLLDQLTQKAENAIGTAELTAATAREMITRMTGPTRRETRTGQSSEPLDEQLLVLPCYGLGRIPKPRREEILCRRNKG